MAEGLIDGRRGWAVGGEIPAATWRRGRAAAVAGLAAALLVAGAGEARAQSGISEAPGAADAETTFSRDVAPILQRSCQHCHQPAGIAPMSLLTYRDARPWARSIRDRVARRLMPPWHLDPTVGIRDYKNDISLTEDEIDTVVRWVDAGAPQGDPADLPEPLAFPPADAWEVEALLGRPPRLRRPLDALPRGGQRTGPVVVAGDRLRGLRRPALHPRGRVQAVLPARSPGHAPRARHAARPGVGRGGEASLGAPGRHGDRQALGSAARGGRQAAAAGPRHGPLQPPLLSDGRGGDRDGRGRRLALSRGRGAGQGDGRRAASSTSTGPTASACGPATSSYRRTGTWSWRTSTSWTVRR